MDKFLLKAFQNLPAYEVPNELHARILRSVIFHRSWKYVWFLTVLLAVMFVFSLWHLYTRGVETESAFTIQTVLDTVELNSASITDSFRTLADTLPIQPIAISLFNLVALIFMAIVLRSFSKIQHQFRI